MESVTQEGGEEGLAATLGSLYANDQGRYRTAGFICFRVLRAMSGELGEDMGAHVLYGLGGFCLWPTRAHGERFSLR